MQYLSFRTNPLNLRCRRAGICLASAAAAAAMVAISQSALAADAYWDNGSGNALWNTTSNNWTGTSWNNAAANAAVFPAGPATIITVSQPVSASSINFTSGGYDLGGSSPISLVAGTGTLSGYTNSFSAVSVQSGGYSGVVDVTAANIAEIDAPISSTVGFKKEGTGTLILGGALSFTGSYPLTGGLNYNTGAYTLAQVNTQLTANLAVGGTTPTTGGSASTVGGVLKLASTATLPSTTTVSIGDGILDLGANNYTLGGLTFANQSDNFVTKWNTSSTTNDPLAGGYGVGVLGTGTLTVNGDINVLYPTVDQALNTIECNLNIGSGGQVCRLTGFNGKSGLIVSGSISGPGALVAVPGLGVAGGPSGTATAVSSAYFGSLCLVNNNTNTGPITFATGVNYITATNATTSVTISNGATTNLLTQNGSLGSVATISAVNGGTFAILNDAAFNLSDPGGTASAPAANNNDRISNTAAIVLRDGGFSYQGSSGASSTETFGSLNASAGANTLTITNGSSGTVKLTATNLNLGPTATLLVSSASLGTTAQQLFTGSVPAADSTGIIPRMAVLNTTTSSTDFVTYNPSAGLIAYSNYATDLNSGGNAAITSTINGVSTATINALKLGGNATLYFNGPNEILTVGSGMIAVDSGSVNYIEGPMGAPSLGTLDFGSSTAVILGNGSLTVDTPITGSGGLVVSGLSTNATSLYGDLSKLTGTLTLNSGALNLNEGGSSNTSTAFFAPGPINIRSGTVAISEGSGIFVEPTGLGAVTLGEPENAGNLLNVFSAVPVLNLNNPQTSGSVFTRNIVVNNGGLNNSGMAISPGYFSVSGLNGFPEIYTTVSGISETLTGNLSFSSPVFVTSATSPSAYNPVGANFNGSIIGTSILAFGKGTFNINGTLSTSGPIWIGPGASGSTSTTYVNFNGSGSGSTSTITGYSGSKSWLTYNSSGALPTGQISILNSSPTGASAGINDFVIRPVTTSSISNGISIGSDTTFNAPAGVIGTWAGKLTGSSALYVASGNLVIPGGAANTFNGPVTINGSTGVLSLTPGALSPSVITAVNSGTLAIHGTTSLPINVSGGILYPGYGLPAGTATSLTLPGTTTFGPTGTIELDLTAISGLTGTADQLTFAAGTGTPTLNGNLQLVNTSTGGLNFAAGDSFQLFNFNSGLPNGTFASSNLVLPTLPSGLAWSTASLYSSGRITIASTAGPEAWSSTTSGNWETAGNWSLGIVPGGEGTIEGFGNSIGTGSATVTLNAPETSGTLTFNGSAGGAYTLTGAALSLYNSSTAPAVINVSTGGQTINNTVSFGSPGLTINTGAGSLVFGGSLTGAGPLSIAGNVAVNGSFNASGAVTILPSSTLTLGGSTPGTVTSLALGSSSTLNINSGTFSPALFNTAVGSVTNIAGSATFAANSAGQPTFNVTGGAINVSGAMNLGTATGTNYVNEVNLNNATLTIKSGGTFFTPNGVTLASGSMLVDNGSFSIGMLSSSTGSIGQLTANTGTSFVVGSGASWLAGVQLFNGSSGTFAGANTGNSVKPLFLPRLAISPGSETNAYGVFTPSGSLTLGVSSSSANRTFLVVGAPGGLLLGNIDLGNNDMTDLNVNYTGLGGLQTFWTQIQSGYNFGGWNGPDPTSVSGEVISSSAAASDPIHLHALGVILNDAGLNTNGTPTGILYSNFDNWNASPYGSANPLTSNDVLIKYTYYGDANLDGKVDGSDYSLIDNGFQNQLTGWFNGDFNYDGVVDGSDYSLIDNVFNNQGAPIPAESAASTAMVAGRGGTSVPEPASVALVAFGAGWFVCRRRRTRCMK